MLSKSAARTFFLGGTALCSIAFILLTADTLSQFDDRTNADQLTESVIRGNQIYTDNNCMGCHTLMGEGGYYAPELTQAVTRRGETWIRLFLKDPQAMYPGRRKMVKYDFFDPDIDPNAEQNVTDILAFLSWVEKIDMNGYPPEPDLTPPNQAKAIAADQWPGAPTVFTTLCVSCHSLKGAGGRVGPALDDVAKRYSTEELGRWLKDPQAYKPGTTMPNLGLTEATITELVTYFNEQE